MRITPLIALLVTGCAAVDTGGDGIPFETVDFGGPRPDVAGPQKPDLEGAGEDLSVEADLAMGAPDVAMQQMVDLAMAPDVALQQKADLATRPDLAVTPMDLALAPSDLVMIAVPDGADLSVMPADLIVGPDLAMPDLVSPPDLAGVDGAVCQPVLNEVVT